MNVSYWIRTLLVVGLLGTSTLAATAQKKLSVVTSLTDLAQIAEAIGGDKVEVLAIATGFQNPHFVDPKPSYILKLSRADLFVSTGLDLTSGWVPPLLSSARNAKIQIGGAGYVDASTGVQLLNVPTSTSREQGDIHVYGNPHYWLDPANGHIIAKNIYEGLVRLQPQNQAYFSANLDRFDQALEAKIVQWAALMKPYQGAEVVAYHDQWPYFEKAFGLKVVDFLEPKPGIPPTPSQLSKVMETMKSKSISIIIMSPYEKPDTAKMVARQSNGKTLVLATSVGAFPEVKTYLDVFDYNVNLIVTALKTAGK